MAVTIGAATLETLIAHFEGVELLPLVFVVMVSSLGNI